eukprot:gnl/Trimastix_PCT/4595.p2 GENE.gnl/Trimastix_PCT/4595~~gnl/Trimastix_PCT/4595.p2  ORF type:complete len:330 (-),score=77.68 gnl/Trimastix_PCT/4595:108-1049(-)
MEGRNKKKIGYLFAPHKKEHYTFQRLAELTQQAPDLQCQFMEFRTPFQDQGHFDLILHKATAELTDPRPEPQALIHNLEEYCQENHCKLIEPFEKLRPLTSRKELAELLAPIDVSMSLPGASHPVQCRAPPFLYCEEAPTEEALRDRGIEFPILVKPLLACGKSASHQFDILFKAADLGRIKSASIVQPLVPHREAVYKAYVIDDFVRYFTRASLRSHFSAADAQAPISFHSGNYEPVTSSAHLDATPLDDEFLQQINQQLHAQLGIALFGFDLVESTVEPGLFWIVDVNYLPTYSNIDEAPAELLRYLRRFL